MKRLLFLGVGSALVFTMGGVGPAQADGGQHISGAQVANTPGVIIAQVGAGKCASCHRAHTAKAEYLLKEAQPALCYTCHGGGAGANTDVQFGTSGGALNPADRGALRGGGFETAKIGSGSATKDMGALSGTRIATLNQKIPVLVGAPAATTSKHNINGGAGDAGTAWGNGAINSGLGKSLTLECGSCHDPHGNGNYRILRPIPVDSGTSKTTDSLGNATTGITIPDVPADVAGQPSNHIYTTGNYWLTGDAKSPAGGTALTGTAKVTDAATDGYIQNIAAWCTTCHTRYLADSGSFETPNKGYPAVTGATGPTDTTFMYRHRSDANYKQGAANCITCHVSHGSNAVMAGVSIGLNPGNTPVVGADSRLLRVDNRGTCLMCHNV